MKQFLRRMWSWYQRRFCGYVAAPRDLYGVRRGTCWQEHFQEDDLNDFFCRCGRFIVFTSADYFIRTQDHIEGCENMSEQPGCHCPVTDARYVKICPQCGLGHWKQATRALEPS